MGRPRDLSVVGQTFGCLRVDAVLPRKNNTTQVTTTCIQCGTTKERNLSNVKRFKAANCVDCRSTEAAPSQLDLPTTIYHFVWPDHLVSVHTDTLANAKLVLSREDHQALPQAIIYKGSLKLALRSNEVETPTLVPLREPHWRVSKQLFEVFLKDPAAFEQRPDRDSLYLNIVHPQMPLDLADLIIKAQEQDKSVTCSSSPAPDDQLFVYLNIFG